MDLTATATQLNIEHDHHHLHHADYDPYFEFVSHAWAFMQLSTAVFGVQLYYKYPYMIQNDVYWLQTCPDGNPIYKAIDGKEAIQAKNNQPYVDPVYSQWGTGWNAGRCLMANDIWGWTLTSKLAMWPSIFSFLFWWVNSFYDNAGGWMHKLFHHWTMITPVFTIAMFAVANWTSMNYAGDIVSAQKSWWLDPKEGTHRNLLQRVQQQIPINKSPAIPTAQSLFNYYSYDVNYTWAFSWSIIFSVVSLAVSRVACPVFTQHYNNAVEFDQVEVLSDTYADKLAERYAEEESKCLGGLDENGDAC